MAARAFGLGLLSHSMKDFGASRKGTVNHAERLAELGADIVIPCVKNLDGNVDFLTDVADVNPEYPEWDPLKVLTEFCQDRGIQLHTWFCVLEEGGRSRLRREHPGYVARVGFSMSTWSPESRYVNDPPRPVPAGPKSRNTYGEADLDVARDRG